IGGEVNDEQDQFLGNVEKLDLTKYIPLEPYPENDRALIPLLRKTQESEVTKYLNKNSPFSGIWENIIQPENEELSDDTKLLMVEYLHPKLKKLLLETPISFVIPDKKAFKTKNLSDVGIETNFIEPMFFVEPVKGGVQLLAKVNLNGQVVGIEENEID